MAFHICNELEQKSQVTIICDSTADIATLPNNLCPGSIAVVATTDLPKYMLNASYEWKEV